MFSAQSLPINSWPQDLTNKAYINVEFGSAISPHGKFDHLVNLVKGSFVSFIKSGMGCLRAITNISKNSFHYVQAHESTPLTIDQTLDL